MILSEERRAEVFELLDASGCWATSSEVERMKGVQQPPNSIPKATLDPHAYHAGGSAPSLADAPSVSMHDVGQAGHVPDSPIATL